MVITKDNVVDYMLNTWDAISLCPAYDYKTPKWWRVGKEIQVKLIHNGEIITIEPKFDTDCSSSPKWLWSLFPPFGDFLLAAIIHDYLYVKKPFGITQKDADKEMYEWSKILNDNKYDNIFRYHWVRILGRLAWEGKLTKFFNKDKKDGSKV